MFIQIDLESEKPIYLQLVHQIVEGIAKGDLQPGEALPSVRSMATDIGINLHTVNKAYQQLKQEQFILVHRRIGVVVNPDGPPAADDIYIENLEDKLRPLIADTICRGMTKQEFESLLRHLYSEFEEEGK